MLKDVFFKIDNPLFLIGAETYKKIKTNIAKKS